MNFSTFLVIGKTSPVTYQVLGHLKTCLVLGFGYTLLHDPFTERNIVGILVAIVGMGLYSYFCTHENKKKQLNDLAGSQVYPPPSLSQICTHARTRTIFQNNTKHIKKHAKYSSQNDMPVSIMSTRQIRSP